MDEDIPLSAIKIIIPLGHTDMLYSISDIEYMIAGIIHLKFDNNSYIFDCLVSESLLFNKNIMDDKSVIYAMQNYYGGMANVLEAHLMRAGIDKFIKKYIDTHYVHDVLIRGTSIIMEMQPKYGHNNNW